MAYCDLILLVECVAKFWEIETHNDMVVPLLNFVKIIKKLLHFLFTQIITNKIGYYLFRGRLKVAEMLLWVFSYF